MKGYAALITLLMTATIAQAQQRTLPPEAQQKAGDLLKQLQQQSDLSKAAFRLAIGGAWWTNAELAARLGLTDDQKAKLQRAFDNHRQALTANTEQLNKEEGQLAVLLQADTIDRNAVLAEIDRVVQARGELERTNAAMTLEMREALTKAQWMQVPQPSLGLSLMRGPNGAVWLEQLPGIRGGGGRGQRGDGQRNGGQRQQ